MASSIFYDGKRAKAHQVEVALEGESLIVRASSGEVLADWPCAALSRLTSREAPGEYCLHRGGMARLILRDPSVQMQLASIGSALSRPPRAWRKEARIVGICLATAFVLGLFFWQGIPFLAKPIAGLISKEAEYKLGQLAYESLLDRFDAEICHTEAGDEALGRLAGHLLDSEDLGLLPEIDPYIVIADSKQENALALPGGFVIIFRGLLDKADDPDMLAGVLAHEAGHIAYRHGVQRAVGSSVLWFFYSFLTSDIFSAPAFAVLLLADNAYTRGMEYEADLFARDLMRKKNINPEPLARWFQGFEDKKGDNAGNNILQYFMTHPDSGERAEFFQKKPGAKMRPSLSQEDWAALKNICGGS